MQFKSSLVALLALAISAVDAQRSSISMYLSHSCTQPTPAFQARTSGCNLCFPAPIGLRLFAVQTQGFETYQRVTLYSDSACGRFIHSGGGGQCLSSVPSIASVYVGCPGSKFASVNGTETGDAGDVETDTEETEDA